MLLMHLAVFSKVLEEEKHSQMLTSVCTVINQCMYNIHI